MGRTKGSKNKSKMAPISHTSAPGKRGRKPKVKAHLELAEAAQAQMAQDAGLVRDILEYDAVTHDGQKAKCHKCGIDITFFVQPKVKEEKLEKSTCCKCEG